MKRNTLEHMEEGMKYSQIVLEDMKNWLFATLTRKIAEKV